MMMLIVKRFKSSLTGSCASNLLRMFKLMNVVCISESTFYRHVSSYVSPVIIQHWKTNQHQLFNTLRASNNNLILAGHGRCDSPNYCAKFGSFTLIEQGINKVVDFQLVQVRSTRKVQKWIFQISLLTSDVLSFCSNF